MNEFAYLSTKSPFGLKRISTLLLMAIGLLLCVSGFAQKKELEKADEYFKQSRYAEAAPVYEQVLQDIAKKNTNRNTLHIKTKLAWCYKMNNRHREAEQLYAQIVTEERAKPIMMLYYGEALIINGNYGTAKKWLLKYQAFDPDDPTAALLIRSCEMVPLIQPFFENIITTFFVHNSEADDNSPIAISEGILFSSDRNSGLKLLKEKSGWTGRDYLDVYISEKLPDGNYAAPKRYSSKLSVLNKNVCNASITGDGSQLYFTRNDAAPNKREVYNLQLYVANSAGDKWKDIEKLPFCSSNFNYMHPAISLDGQWLFFTSNSSGGEGGTDIWLSRKTAGGWERPENLGPLINTSLNEGFPFFDARGRLFFCSKGHPGFGGFDIFVSERMPDGTWAPPVNLGKPINSSYDDISIYISTDEAWGMFTSARDGGDDDIYLFRKAAPGEMAQAPEHTPVNIPETKALIAPQKDTSQDLFPDQVAEPVAEQAVETSVSEAVAREESDEKSIAVMNPPKHTKVDKQAVTSPLQGTHTQQEREIPKEKPQSVAFPQTTAPETITPSEIVEHTSVLPDGVVEKPANPNLNTDGAVASTATELDPTFPTPKAQNGLYAFSDFPRKLNLNSLQKGDRFRLDGARYDVNVWQPTPQVARALDLLADYLRLNPSVRIELSAHSESLGLDAYNMELTEKRAQVARDYLIREGIKPARIIAKGYGETMLLNHCHNGVECSRSEHLANQRLEIVVLEY